MLTLSYFLNILFLNALYLNKTRNQNQLESCNLETYPGMMFVEFNQFKLSIKILLLKG